MSEETARKLDLPYVAILAVAALVGGGGAGSALSGSSSAEVRAVGAEVRAMEARLSGKLDVLTAEGQGQGRQIEDHEARLRALEGKERSR